MRPRMLSRATSMPPPVVFEILFRRRGKLAGCRPRFQESLRDPETEHQIGETTGDGVGRRRLHRGEPSAEQQALDEAIEFALNGVAAIVGQVVIQTDPPRANVRAGATKRARVGQVRPFLRVTQMRCDDGTDGSLVGGAVSMTADILVNRA